MTARHQVTLRPASGEDADLVFRITEACMKDYAERTWGSWDEERTRQSFVPATHEIVQYQGQDIGCIERSRASSKVSLNKLYILPAYQNRGIGTALMRQIMDDAGSAKKSIHLTVLLVNPARRFYERLGFVVTHSTAERHHMSWNGHRQDVPKNPA
jgi:ribosomal protein S18 acetylase RimI-like enzyme